MLMKVKHDILFNLGYSGIVTFCPFPICSHWRLREATIDLGLHPRAPMILKTAIQWNTVLVEDRLGLPECIGNCPS
jgi:hypothetical protein